MINLSLFDGRPANVKSLSMRRPVLGVGVNDAGFLVSLQIGGKIVQHPAYVCWLNMLKRCYCPKYKAKHPSYNSASVSCEWLLFSNFLSWWKVNHRDGFELDKDLLSDTKIYSEDNCVFIPQWLNKFTVGSDAARGVFRIGVDRCKRTKRFRAAVWNPTNGEREHLGMFCSEGAAYNAWLERKLEIAKSLKDKIDAIDTRLFERIIFIINNKD